MTKKFIGRSMIVSRADRAATSAALLNGNRIARCGMRKRWRENLADDFCARLNDSSFFIQWHKRAGARVFVFDFVPQDLVERRARYALDAACLGGSTDRARSHRLVR